MGIPSPLPPPRLRLKSQPAIQRIPQAVSEIKRVARKDRWWPPKAVLFLERLSPAIEQVDSSSGAIGTAVNKAIADLAAVIAAARLMRPRDSDGWSGCGRPVRMTRSPISKGSVTTGGELCIERACLALGR